MTTDVFEPTLLPDEVKLDLCLDLLEEFGVARSQIKVRRHAGEIDFKCVMPWHDEKKASAGLNYQKLVYSCFSCGSSGGLLWMIGTCRDGSTHQAREWLENRAGLSGDADLPDVLRLIDAIDQARPQKAPPIPHYAPRVLDPWRWVHPWLTEIRGVPESTIVELSLGYAERYPIRDEDRSWYSERIVIPHFWRGELVGWQSRQLAADGSSKYLSTPDFPKDRTIYNHRGGHTAVVVEAPLSAARHHHHQPMRATFGAMVTDRQCRVLADYERVVLWMDNDPAGWNAVTGWTNEISGDWVPGVAERLAPYCDVWVVDSEWAADPGDMDDAAVDELVELAVPYSVWRRPEQLRCWRCTGTHEGKCTLPNPLEEIWARM